MFKLLVISFIIHYGFLLAIYHPNLMVLEKKLLSKNPSLIVDKWHLKMAKLKPLANTLWKDLSINIKATTGESFQLRGASGKVIYTFEQDIPFLGRIIANGLYWKKYYELEKGLIRETHLQVIF